MSDKPSFVESPFSLPDQRILQLKGRDSLAFAQAQTMNDVKALTDGAWQWNGWLNPKGRVIALFALLRRDAETLWLILPDADPAALAAQLQRFVFRSKVVLTPRDDLQVTGGWTSVGSASSNIAKLDEAATWLDMSGAAQARSLCIAPAREAAISPADVQAWKAADLLHGWPRLSSQQVERWTPQQLALGRLSAYSVKKGCYPGQEIVARTHFLGEAKRALQLLEASSPMTEGASVTDASGNALGEVISVAGNSAAWIGTEAAAGNELRCGDRVATVVSWQPGLTR